MGKFEKIPNRTTVRTCTFYANVGPWKAENNERAIDPRITAIRNVSLPNEYIAENFISSGINLFNSALWFQ